MSRAAPTKRCEYLVRAPWMREEGISRRTPAAVPSHPYRRQSANLNTSWKRRSTGAAVVLEGVEKWTECVEPQPRRWRRALRYRISNTSYTTVSDRRSPTPTATILLIHE